MTPREHDLALSRGLIRYCPICDGYEVTDQRVAIIGTGSHGSEEAMFLRGYTRNLSLVAPAGAHQLSWQDRHEMEAAGIQLLEGLCGPLRIEGETIVIPTASGDRSFDTVYPALGSVIRSELALSLGARSNDEGCLIVDEHQRTTVRGLYAAGDVTNGLDQISHAMGEAAVAATTIRNDLAKMSALFR